MAKKRKNVTVEDIRRWHGEAAAEWLRENVSEAAVKDVVKGSLDRSMENVVAKAAGFTERWSGHGWELDSQSERGETGKKIGEWAQRYVTEYMEGLLKSGELELPKFDAKTKTALRRLYKSVMKSKLREAVTELAEAHVREVAEKVLEGVDIREVQEAARDERSREDRGRW